MKALVCTQLGDPLSDDASKKPLQLKQDHPAPPLKDGAVRIRVVAASLNFADALQLQASVLRHDSKQ
jgi:NADPH:quinone reductase-like Zn-dependent oxidoreductase